MEWWDKSKVMWFIREEIAIEFDYSRQKNVKTFNLEDDNGKLCPVEVIIFIFLHTVADVRKAGNISFSKILMTFNFWNLSKLELYILQD